MVDNDMPNLGESMSDLYARTDNDIRTLNEEQDFCVPGIDGLGTHAWHFYVMSAMAIFVTVIKIVLSLYNRFVGQKDSPIIEPGKANPRNADSVDGAKLDLFGSDEASAFVCGPCADEDDNDEKEATYYCEKCALYLCKACKDDHKKFNGTKRHTITLLHLVRRGLSESGISAFKASCNCSKSNEVSNFCETHVCFVCSACKRIKHNGCKTTLIQDKVPTDIFRFSAVLMKANVVKTNLKIFKRVQEDNREKIKKNAQECKQEIEAFRQGICSNICDALENMEKEVLRYLNENTEQRERALEYNISRLEAAWQALKLNIETIEKGIGDNEAVTLATYIMTAKNLQDSEGLIDDLRMGHIYKQFTFDKNRELEKLASQVESIGRTEIQETNLNRKDIKTVLDMEVKSSDTINIKLSEDRNDPDITGCTFLPNGFLLICDWGNSKMKMLDRSWTVMDRLTLPDRPWCVVVVNMNKAVITFYEAEKLQFIHISPEMKLADTIPIHAQCRCIDVVNNEIYTICHRSTDEDEIWRLDLKGNIKQKIRLTQDSTYGSWYLRAGGPKTNLCIYFTNTWALTCVSIYDGSVVFQYADKYHLQWANDLYVDSTGNTLVCDTESNNVVVISADGKWYRDLFTSREVTEPKVIAFRPEDNTLVVGCERNSALFIFTLGL